MNKAIDANGNILCADDESRYKECFCRVCGEPVTHKKGKVRRPYFAHLPDTNCHYGQDKDYKSEWHIRMQDYYPKEAQEYLFVDEETGEKHIADVYVKEANTVLEFQHSPIDEREFVSRTYFHLKNNRRIVWLFDESSEKEGSSRFKTGGCSLEQWPYTDRCFKWLHRQRSFLQSGPPIAQFHLCYSVCVYTGTEEDVFHRIVAEHYGFQYVTFSLHDIRLNNNTDIEDFFRPESYWHSQEPWKTRIEREAQRQMQAQAAQRVFPIIIPSRPKRGKRW